jgi:hypothetical protein
VKDGKHNSNSTWSPSKPSFGWSNRNDTIIIKHDVKLEGNLNNMYATLIIDNGAKFYNDKKTIKIVQNAKLINQGTLEIKKVELPWGSPEVVNGGVIKLKGELKNTEGTFTNNGQIEVGGEFKNGWDGDFVNNGSLNLKKSLSNENDFTNNGSLAVKRDLKNLSGSTFNSTDSIDIQGHLKNQGTLSQSGFTYVKKDFKNEYGGTATISGNLDVDDDMIVNGNLALSGTVDVADDFDVDWHIPFSNAGNLSIGGDAKTEGVFTNTGAVSIAGDLEIDNDLINHNTINVSGDASSDWGSEIVNEGTLFVVNDFTNNGDFENNGTFLVDGSVDSSNGDITGTGDLCNSDGSTDPTGGAKGSVSCNICDGDGGGSLPIELLSFNARYINMVAVIEWSTATEINNDYFVLEVSRDGVEFIELAIIDGNGNSNELLTYSYQDVDVQEGIQYYRIKQVDFDGAFEYFDPIALVVEKTTNLNANVYPNPASSGQALNIKTNGLVNVELYSSNGQLVKRVESVNEFTSISTDDLQKGFYILKIYDGQEVVSRKVHIL